MNQKNFAILFVLITIIAVIIIGLSKFKNSSPLTSTPATNLTDQSLASPGVSSSSANPVVKTYNSFPGVLPKNQISNKKAVVETDKGSIEFEIYPEATKAASNFVFLATDHFYDGLVFHRVVPGFVIQGGDPLGTGVGGPGYTFKEDVVKGSYDKGIVAMAKRADEPVGTGGSQFFIMLENNPLPPDYVIFGKVIKGQEVVSKIQIGDVMKQVTILPLK